MMPNNYYLSVMLDELHNYACKFYNNLTRNGKSNCRKKLHCGEEKCFIYMYKIMLRMSKNLILSMIW